MTQSIRSLARSPSNREIPDEIDPVLEELVRGIIGQVADNLRKRFPSLEPAEIESAAQKSVADFTGLPVQDYISVLAERAAKNSLRKAHPDVAETKKADR